MAAAVWQKLFASTRALGLSAQKGAEHCVRYSRKINSFLQVLDFVPEVRDGHGALRPPSEFKEIHFTDDADADAVLCCLNSTLYRWFIDVTTDGSHLNRREIEGFPFDPVRERSNAGVYRRLASRLMASLNASSLRRTMRYAHDTLTVQCIVPKNSKPVIDEIDCVLARHYGFTDEELDFIINYDIKYRMGSGGNGGADGDE